MTTHDLHDLLDRAGDRAPRLDPSAIARQAQASAVRRHRRRLVAGPALAVVAVLVAAGAVNRLNDGAQGQPGSGRTARVSPATSPLTHPAGWSGASFTCCAEVDVDQAARPGSTFLVHWIPAGSGPPSRVSLSVTLSGPYATVQQLKSGAPAAASYPSAPLIATTGTHEPPASTITLPTDVEPGLYNLVTQISTLDKDGRIGVSSSGASVVTVTK